MSAIDIPAIIRDQLPVLRAEFPSFDWSSDAHSIHASERPSPDVADPICMGVYFSTPPPYGSLVVNFIVPSAQFHRNPRGTVAPSWVAEQIKSHIQHSTTRHRDRLSRFISLCENP